MNEDPQGESKAEPRSDAKISQGGVWLVREKRRVFTGLIFLLAVVMYAALLALAATALLEAGAFVNQGSAQVGIYLVAPAFYIPIIVFAVMFFVLVFLVSRRWRSKYVGGGLIIAVLVYFSAIGGALLTVSAWTLTSLQFNAFFVQVATSPLIIAAAIVAREIPVWFGAWIRARECSNKDEKCAGHEDSGHEGHDGASSESLAPPVAGAPRAAHALSPIDAVPSSPAGSPPPTLPPVNAD